MPLEALRPLAAVAVNVGITVGLLLFLTFPANLFNQTFVENYADISAWWRKWSLVFAPERARRRIRVVFAARFTTWSLLRRAGGHEAEQAEEGERNGLAFGAVVIVGSLLVGLLDPVFGANLRTLTSFIAMALAMLAGVSVSGLVTGTYHRARHHANVPRKLHALPLGRWWPRRVLLFRGPRALSLVTFTAWFAA